MLHATVALLLVVAVVGPGLGGLLSLRPSRRSGRVAVVGTGAASASAVLVAIATGLDHAGSWSSGGRLLVEVDRVGALLLVFVLLSTLVAQAYAERSLRGDVARSRFFAASGCAASATATVAVAADLWVLVAGWIGVSLATAALLRHDGRPSSSAAGRRAARTFLIGDAALVAAAVAAAVAIGQVTLRPQPMAAIADSSTELFGIVGLGAVLAMAAVVAAITRCALPPAQTWLPMSVAAPTPSSAMLHAGIVNGGGVVLIRFAPVLGVSSAAAALALAGGCTGVLVGSAVSRTRSDVKTTLAWSTVSQMGFMVVQCATGLIGPALIHMVAHGMYKSNLFLGSGSVLGHAQQPPHAAAGARGGLRGALARGLAVVVATAAAVGIALVVVRPGWFEGVAGLVLLGFATVTVASIVSAWLRTRDERSALDLVAFGALAVATTASVAVAALLEHWLAPDLPDVEPALATIGAVALAATALVGWAAAVLSTGPALRGHRLVERMYLWAAHLGDPARGALTSGSSEVRP